MKSSPFCSHARLAHLNRVEQSNAGRAINTPHATEGLSSRTGQPSDSGGYPEKIPACEAGSCQRPAVEDNNVRIQQRQPGTASNLGQVAWDDKRQVTRLSSHTEKGGTHGGAVKPLQEAITSEESKSANNQGGCTTHPPFPSHGIAWTLPIERALIVGTCLIVGAVVLVRVGA